MTDEPLDPEVTPARLEVPLAAEGVSYGRGYETDAEPADRLQPSAATSLADIAVDHVLFTHALLFTHARWRFDPVVTFLSEQPSARPPGQLLLPRPVFAHLSFRDETGRLDDRYDRTLWVCPKAAWKPLYAFLCSLGGKNQDARYFHTTVPQLVRVVDVLTLDRASVLPDPVPTVPCVCFAVSSNRNMVYFNAAHRKAAWGPVPVVVRSPEPSIVRYAKALFAFRPNPMAGTVEKTVDQAVADLRADVDRARHDLPEGSMTPEEYVRWRSEG